MGDATQLLDESTIRSLITHSYDPYDLEVFKPQVVKLYSTALPMPLKEKCFIYMFNKYIYWIRKGDRSFDYEYVLSLLEDFSLVIPRQSFVSLIQMPMFNNYLWTWFKINYKFK